MLGLEVFARVFDHNGGQILLTKCVDDDNNPAVKYSFHHRGLLIDITATMGVAGHPERRDEAFRDVGIDTIVGEVEKYAAGLGDMLDVALEGDEPTPAQEASRIRLVEFDNGSKMHLAIPEGNYRARGSSPSPAQEAVPEGDALAKIREVLHEQHRRRRPARQQQLTADGSSCLD